MRGPIDYIIVGFDGLKFDGSVLQAIADAIDSGAIALVDLSAIAKEADGTVHKLNMSEISDEVTLEFVEKYHPDDKDVTADDITEVAELLENNTAAALLVIEQLWAKPLKQALLNANAVLIAEGRIHPDAVAELTEGEE